MLVKSVKLGLSRCAGGLCSLGRLYALAWCYAPSEGARRVRRGGCACMLLYELARPRPLSLIHISEPTRLALI
eukprot:9140566-Alexandrium_andersonii.AAC.1